MQKKHKLVSEFDNDYVLIGIASHLKDYRLIWSLNETMKLHFVKLDDLKVFNDKLNEMLYFPLFVSEESDTFKTFYFIGNHNNKAFLINEQKQFHYFLLIKGVVNNELKTEILTSLKKITNVLTAITIPVASIKNFELVLADLELHMMEIEKMNRSIPNTPVVTEKNVIFNGQFQNQKLNNGAKLF